MKIRLWNIFRIVWYVATYLVFSIIGLTAAFLGFLIVDYIQYRAVKVALYLPKKLPIETGEAGFVLKVCPECRRLHFIDARTCVVCFHDLKETLVPEQVFVNYWRYQPKTLAIGNTPTTSTMPPQSSQQ